MTPDEQDPADWRWPVRDWADVAAVLGMVLAVAAILVWMVVIL